MACKKKNGVCVKRPPGAEYLPKSTKWCTGCVRPMKDRIPSLILTPPKRPRKSKYNELLYAVERKFPGETRHETALRYIREAEQRCLQSETKENTDGNK